MLHGRLALVLPFAWGESALLCMITGLGDCLPASGPLALVAVWKSMGGFQTYFWEDLKRG